MKNELVKKKPFNGLHLAARITGLIWVSVILFFNIGYLFEGYQNNGNQFVVPDDPLAVLTVLSLYVGLAGLILAFWKTIQGVILSSIGFLFAALFLILDPKLNFSFIALVVIFIPTLLYFAYWRETRKIA